MLHYYQNLLLHLGEARLPSDIDPPLAGSCGSRPSAERLVTTSGRVHHQAQRIQVGRVAFKPPTRIAKRGHPVVVFWEKEPVWQLLFSRLPVAVFRIIGDFGKQSGQGLRQEI